MCIMDLLTEIENPDISQLQLIDVTDNKKISHDSCYELEIKDPNEIILANYNGKKYVYDIIDRLPLSELNKLANKYGSKVYKDRSDTIRKLKCIIYDVEEPENKNDNNTFYLLLIIAVIGLVIATLSTFTLYLVYMLYK